MDEKRNQGNDLGGPAREIGLTYKAAELGAQEVTDEELRAINKFALSPLSADDVFTFKAVLCDTEIDRQYEHFTPKALGELAKLFLGRTVIKDHIARADNQVGRIYATEVVDTGKKMRNGEPYQQLQARIYMVRLESNADMIKEIQAGIKKEGSVGFRASSAICSICGTDNTKSYCAHWPGRTYAKEGGSKVCTFKLDGVKDAYEFSLVAVPAQRAAGTTKSYTGVTVFAKDPDDDPAPEAPSEDDIKAKELALRARLADAKNKIKI